MRNDIIQKRHPPPSQSFGRASATAYYDCEINFPCEVPWIARFVQETSDADMLRYENTGFSFSMSGTRALRLHCAINGIPQMKPAFHRKCVVPPSRSYGAAGIAGRLQREKATVIFGIRREASPRYGAGLPSGRFGRGTSLSTARGRAVSKGSKAGSKRKISSLIFLRP